MKKIGRPPVGPSPRVWGILGGGSPRLMRFRSIPTRVGNTIVDRVRLEDLSVHPHACGEYFYRRVEVG